MDHKLQRNVISYNYDSGGPPRGPAEGLVFVSDSGTAQHTGPLDTELVNSQGAEDQTAYGFADFHQAAVNIPALNSCALSLTRLLLRD